MRRDLGDRDRTLEDGWGHAQHLGLRRFFPGRRRGIDGQPRPAALRCRPAYVNGAAQATTALVRAAITHDTKLAARADSAFKGNATKRSILRGWGAICTYRVPRALSYIASARKSFTAQWHASLNLWTVPLRTKLERRVAWGTILDVTEELDVSSPDAAAVVADLSTRDVDARRQTRRGGCG